MKPLDVLYLHVGPQLIASELLEFHTLLKLALFKLSGLLMALMYL